MATYSSASSLKPLEFVHVQLYVTGTNVHMRWITNHVLDLITPVFPQRNRQLQVGFHTFTVHTSDETCRLCDTIIFWRLFFALWSHVCMWYMRRLFHPQATGDGCLHHPLATRDFSKPFSLVSRPCGVRKAWPGNEASSWLP